jgi:hypothetical protein
MSRFLSRPIRTPCLLQNLPYAGDVLNVQLADFINASLSFTEALAGCEKNKQTIIMTKSPKHIGTRYS